MEISSIHPITGRRMAYNSLAKRDEANRNRITINGRRTTRRHAERLGLSVVPTCSRVDIPGANASFDDFVAGRVSVFQREDEALEAEVRAGYVYLAHQRHRDNLVKIGFSLTPAKRAAAWNTGLPVDEEFVIRRMWYVADKRAAEKFLHAAFDEFLVAGRRELFTRDIVAAEACIDALLREREAA